MISKTLLKKIASYKQKKYRDLDKVFVVEGEKMVKEAILSSFEIVCICAIKDWIENNKDLLEQIEYYEVSYSELERISNLTTPNSVLAILSQKEMRMPDIKNISNNLSLMLDNVSNPGNFGTIVRLCSWFGIKNIICSETTTDCYNPKVVQASMGAIFHTDIHYCNILDLLDSLPKDLPIYATVLREGKNIYMENLAQKGIIVLGNESFGVSKEVLQRVTHKITIPSFAENKQVESLNVSMATAIILSEFRREVKKNI
ncbi:MAG: RNA methyltransferase [Bacteroidota bacterium]|nr:RNA methyltransferase [Bacteroidota bacterium]